MAQKAAPQKTYTLVLSHDWGRMHNNNFRFHSAGETVTDVLESERNALQACPHRVDEVTENMPEPTRVGQAKSISGSASAPTSKAD